MKRARRRWWPASLRRQLVIGVSAIVATAILSIGAVAEVGLRNEMFELADAQVANSLAALNYSYAKATITSSEPALDLQSLAGQATGTVVAFARDGKVEFAAMYADGEPSSVPPDAVAALEAITWESGDARMVRLGGLGDHEVGSRDLGNGKRLLSAVSLKDANQTLSRYALIVAGLVVLALILAAAATVALVTGALRPLRRVSAVAGQVASLPLDASEYRITARINDRDTDPDSEVGTVGLTLNHMLDNVDAALTERAQSDQRVRQFITDASHELRTPLAAILGYAELTRQESDAIPPMTEYALGRIEAESRRMSTLVSDLLLLSRLDERQDLQVEEVDIAELISDAVNDARVSAPDHHFDTQIPGDPVWVYADRARLQQVVANLLANTRIHTPPGTSVTVRLGQRVIDGRPTVEFEVIDDGPGIPAEIMPNLFGRFVRADKARSREMGSSGLGLAIVASVVEAHHGSVAAASEPGRTVFTVRLPAAHL